MVKGLVKDRSKLRYEKTCACCEKHFVANDHRRTVCSDECRYKQKLSSVKRFRILNEDKVLGYKDKYYKKNKSVILENSKKRDLDTYCQRMYNRTSRNKDSGITKKYIKDLILSNDEKCCITGIPFVYENPYSSFHNPLSPSIDRIDSDKPYHKDNIQITLLCINKMKGDMNNNEFLKMLKENFNWSLG